MANKIDRRDFLRVGLTALAGTALSSFYPMRTEAQNNLAVQVADIEKYVRSHPSETGITRIVPSGQERFLNIPYFQYNDGDFKVRAHDFGLGIQEFLGDGQRFFYNSRQNGLRNVDAIIEVPGITPIEILEMFYSASPRALTSLAQTVSKRREELRMGIRAQSDELIIKRRNPNSTVSIYNFRDEIARRLTYEESVPVLNEMQSAYREVVDKVHRKLIR